MNALLRIYIGADHRHEHIPTWEWILYRAQSFGLPGGTALEGVSGFGPQSRRKGLGLDSLSSDKSMLVELVGERVALESFVGQLQQTTALAPAVVTILDVTTLG
ncbi:MAG: DUF190 domain-containing protein [Acidobacteriota bacterium]